MGLITLFVFTLLHISHSTQPSCLAAELYHRVASPSRDSARPTIRTSKPGRAKTTATTPSRGAMPTRPMIVPVRIPSSADFDKQLVRSAFGAGTLDYGAPRPPHLLGGQHKRAGRFHEVWVDESAGCLQRTAYLLLTAYYWVHTPDQLPTEWYWAPPTDHIPQATAY